MRQTRISKLGIKFMASTLLPALIVLILAGIVCYSVVSQNRISTIRQEVAEQALLCDTEIEDELVRLSELIGLEKGKNTIYNYLTNVESNQKLYFYTKAMKLLNEFTGYNQSIVNSSWVALFDKNLMFSDEYSLEPQKTIQDFSELPWYSEKYLMENEQYVSDVYSAMLGNNKRETKVISIVQPVFDNKTRALIGAYGIDISMIYLNNLLLLDNYSDTLAIVYNDKNDLIFYNGARTEDDYSSLVTDLFTQRAGADKYVVFNERSYYVVSTRFSDMNWFVDYYIRKDDIQNSVNSIAMPLIVTFIIAGVVLTVIMIMFITKFIERVRIVTNNTSEISRGKFDNRMVIDSDDEFGELAIAFNDTIEHLQYKAEHDDITDVYNISTFYVQAERIIKNSQFDRKKYSIVRLDIDHFRMINDIYNWQVGNNVLLHIAECIRRHLADDSICGRISADIFVMCISYESIEQLEEILIAIKEDILTFEIIVNINPHFGVYLDAECDMPVYLMCDRAGMALSLIKGNLLATVSYYDNTINRKNMDIKFIETYMQNAIQDNEFFIQLQPKYDMITNEIVGAEALVRWKSPEKGLIRPDVFIPIFEKNGFIIRLDEYVWEEVCKCIARWQQQGMPYIPISVNVSRIHIYNKHFVENLCRLVEKYQIPVSSLELEFTESALLEDVEELYSVMEQLKEKDFVLLMDDFASGYSSLNTLKYAPFDIVKIDREFINKICDSEPDRVLVDSTISMLNNQNKKIVVEGVEVYEQVELLIESGCRVAQGYYYSQPINIEEFEKLTFGKVVVK